MVVKERAGEPASKCRGEFRLCNLALDYHYPDLFVISQWKWPHTLYLIYRILIAIYTMTWLIMSGVWSYDWYRGEQNKAKWFIYWTNWSSLMLTLSCVIQMVIVIYGYKRSWYTEHGMPVFDKMYWYFKVEWVLYNVSTASTLFCSLVYWFEYTDDIKQIHPVDLNQHMVNSIYVFIDLFVTAIPVRFLHGIQPVVFLTVYTLFSLVYEVAGGTNAKDEPFIYAYSNWDDTARTFLLNLASIFLIMPLLWCVVYGLYRMRTALYKIIYYNDFISPPPEDEDTSFNQSTNSQKTYGGT